MCGATLNVSNFKDYQYYESDYEDLYDDDQCPTTFKWNYWISVCMCRGTILVSKFEICIVLKGFDQIWKGQADGGNKNDIVGATV